MFYTNGEVQRGAFYLLLICPRNGADRIDSHSSPPLRRYLELVYLLGAKQVFQVLNSSINSFINGFESPQVQLEWDATKNY